ncbi:MAG: YraN family protein [Lachnospiraceae bacterium]|nr:YraN family protein [Lachnospiraceae bacterium]
MNNRRIGALHEDEALRWLEKQGVKVIAKNFRCRMGEIDLIARHEKYLLFIEVKYRKSTKAGYPAEAVTLNKQRNICKVADYYRITNHISDSSFIRYDVVGICDNEIRWYQNAFDHIYR